MRLHPAEPSDGPGHGVFARKPDDPLRLPTRGPPKPPVGPGVGAKEDVTEVTVLPDATYEFSDIANQTLPLPLRIGF